MCAGPLEPIQKFNVSDAVADRIIELIVGNHLRPGDKLPSERELAEQLGVGRTSVREGLKRLNTMGLVTVRQGEGVFVNRLCVSDLVKPFPYPGLLSLESKELIDIMHVRKVLELDTAYLAARNATDKELERLEAFLAQMKDLIKDPREFVRVDLSFHVTIAEASGNLILPRLVELVRDLYMRHNESVAALPGINERSYAHHVEIYQAIKARDPEAARKAMLAHLEDSETSIMEDYERRRVSKAGRSRSKADGEVDEAGRAGKVG